MNDEEQKKAMIFRQRQRIQWAPPTIIKGTLVYQIEFLEDVERISLFVHPDLFAFFQINDVRVGSDQIYDYKVDEKRFDNGGLRFTQNPVVRVGTLITLSISNKTETPKMFLANFTALAQLKN